MIFYFDFWLMQNVSSIIDFSNPFGLPLIHVYIKKNKEIFYSTSIVVSKDISLNYFEINVDIKSL